MTLQQYMEQSGLTQVAMARLVGTTQQHLSRIMNGTRAAGPRLAIQIERHTGGKVSRIDLRPDLYRGMRNKVADE